MKELRKELKQRKESPKRDSWPSRRCARQCRVGTVTSSEPDAVLLLIDTAGRRDKCDNGKQKGKLLDLEES